MKFKPVSSLPPQDVVPAAQAFVEAPKEVQAPPLPAHMTQPIVAPPPEPELPTTFEGFVELSKLVSKRQGPVEKSILWATLAQATATKQVADRLEELLLFLGARDTDDDADVDGPRLSHQISDGGLLALDQLLPEGAMDILKAQIAARLAEETK